MDSYLILQHNCVQHILISREVRRGRASIDSTTRNDLYRTIIDSIIWQRSRDDSKNRYYIQAIESYKGGDLVDNQKTIPNRLINETSPYLLQHAHNPVDWYPWGEEAFEKARTEDKPVLLSIGYSTCHWCQVAK